MVEGRGGRWHEPSELPGREEVEMLAMLLFAGGCSTWRYTVQYAAEPLADPVVDVAFVPGGSGGTLNVRNNSAEQVYVVWDELSAVSGTTQAKAYKGSVAVITMQMSVPDQPIGPGLTISEAVHVDGTPKWTFAQRPATAWDYSLCWAYGIGCLIGNTWTPTEDDVDVYFPGWRNTGYDLLVPIRVGDVVETRRVHVAPASVEARRLTTAERDALVAAYMNAR